MPKLRIPKAKIKPKDFTRLPWTEEFRAQFPTHNINNLIEGGIHIEDMRDYLFVEKHMDFRKSNLLVEAYIEEARIVRNDSEVILKICVPVCENQCSNCDRAIFKRTNKCFTKYLGALLREIDATHSLIRKKGYFVKAILFSGNFLVFSANEISRILSKIAYPLCEICIEVSDAKNITRDKLEILRKYPNVRIILNALTFNMVTLRSIHKHFELREIRENLDLLREYNFSLSIRFVVGILKERDLQLLRNVKIAEELGANCIDLYARFCPKIGGPVLIDSQKIADQRRLHEAINDYLSAQKFTPYFLYCTEVQNGCFENVGYCKAGEKSKCVQDIMYGISTMVGCGLGASSMIVKNLNNVKKYFNNTTDLTEYVQNIDDVISQKLEFFG